MPHDVLFRHNEQKESSDTSQNLQKAGQQNLSKRGFSSAEKYVTLLLTFGYNAVTIRESGCCMAV